MTRRFPNTKSILSLVGGRQAVAFPADLSILSTYSLYILETDFSEQRMNACTRARARQLSCGVARSLTFLCNCVPEIFKIDEFTNTGI